MSEQVTEEWARNAEAGPELDRVCAEWMGYSPVTHMGRGVDWYTPDRSKVVSEPPPFSTDWTAAGPLLEAMNAEIYPPRPGRFRAQQRWMAKAVCSDTNSNLAITYGADYLETGGCPCLAIARCCAVLVARGVTREDLETTNE